MNKCFQDTKKENMMVASTAPHQIVTKLPVSFAAMANVAPDISKELTSSASSA
jgi:hypothetical protein